MLYHVYNEPGTPLRARKHVIAVSPIASIIGEERSGSKRKLAGDDVRLRRSARLSVRRERATAEIEVVTPASVELQHDDDALFRESSSPNAQSEQSLRRLRGTPHVLPEAEGFDTLLSELRAATAEELNMALLLESHGPLVPWVVTTFDDVLTRKRYSRRDIMGSGHHVGMAQCWEAERAWKELNDGEVCLSCVTVRPEPDVATHYVELCMECARTVTVHRARVTSVLRHVFGSVCGVNRMSVT